MLAPWDDLRRGIGCPLCLPRPDYDEHHYLVAKLSVSTLYLTRGQQYVGTCAIVLDTRHASYISQLPREEWAQLREDLWEAENAVLQAFSPDHINVEDLGNTVPHLHFGLIPRYKNDGRWGHPIWTTDRKQRPQRCLPEHDYGQMARQILRSLKSR